MNTRIKRILRKIRSFKAILTGKAHASFSQFGEDIIIQKMLDKYSINEVCYLDIGANDPINGSNTYSFYLRGNSGVLIEPNKILCNKINKIRPNDTCLNIGIGDGSATEADYFMFQDIYNGMNTFSEEEAKRYEKEGFAIQNKIKMPLKNINDIIRDHVKHPITLISLDVEGLDEMILNSLDFEKYQPLLVCVETVVFSLHNKYSKRESIINLMKAKNYFIYADTHVNTIFCSQKLFDQLNN